MVMFVCTTSSLWVKTTKDGVKLPFLLSIPFRRHGTLATMFDKSKHFIFSRSFEYTNMYMP